MKRKSVLLLFGLGMVLGLLGVVFKIMHYPYGDLLIMAGLGAMVVGAVGGLYRLLTGKAFDR